MKTPQQMTKIPLPIESLLLMFVCAGLIVAAIPGPAIAAHGYASVSQKQLAECKDRGGRMMRPATDQKWRCNAGHEEAAQEEKDTSKKAGRTGEYVAEETPQGETGPVTKAKARGKGLAAAGLLIGLGGAALLAIDAASTSDGSSGGSSSSGCPTTRLCPASELACACSCPPGTFDATGCRGSPSLHACQCN